MSDPNEANDKGMMMTINAIEFGTADEAIQHYYASGDVDTVVSVGGRFLATNKADAHRMESAGVQFAYVHLHERHDGRETIVFVPVN